MNISLILKPFEKILFDLFTEKSNFGDINTILENDFENFQEYLIKNKLLPLFFEYFSKRVNGNNNIIYNTLKASNRTFQLRQMQLEGAFRTIVPLLHKAGVEVIAIKGIHLSSTIYQKPYHRPMIDIDLLVRKTDMEVAQKCLLGIGATTTPVDSANIMGLWHHVPPFRYNGVAIELHSNLFIEYQFPKFTIENFWKNAVVSCIYQVDCKILNNTDYFFYLCLHAFNHSKFRGFQAIWLVDIYYFAQKNENDIDIENFILLCEINNCKDDIFKIIAAVNELFSTSFFTEKLSLQPNTLFIRNMLNNCAGVYAQKSSIKTFRNVKLLPGFRKKILFVIGKLFPSAAYLRHRFHLEGRFSTIKGYYLLYKRYILKMLQMRMS